jgi:hypothetical protein
MTILLQTLRCNHLKRRVVKQLKRIVYKPIRYYYYAHKLPNIQKVAVLHDSAVVLVDAANIASSVQNHGGKLTYNDVHTILSIISSVGGCSLLGEFCVVTLTITCWLWAQWIMKQTANRR